MSSYLPQTDAEFDSMQNTLVTQSEQNAVAWGIVPDAITELKSYQTPWTEAYAKTINKQNRTPTDVMAKKTAGDNYKKAIRLFVAQWLSVNPKVSDADRTLMGITVRKDGHTPIPAPESFPVGQVDFSIRGQHTLSFYDSASSHSNARPKGVSGCEIYMKVGGEPPLTVDEMRFMGICSASPYVLKHDTVNAGKIVYYWLRWTNSKGETGPWSVMISAMIVG